MSKLITSSKIIAGSLFAGVIGVSVLVWQVTDTGRVSSIDAKPTLGAATPSDWTELPDITNARFEASAVQYQGDVYAFNGFGQSIKVEPTVEKLDADTLDWSVISESSITLGNAVTHNGIVLNGNEVWIIGGRVGNHPGPVTSNVWKFNLDSRVWTAGPALPVPGAAGGAALVNNRIHWFGGLDTVAECDVDNHFVYDLNNPSDSWQDISSIAPMPVPRNHFATVVLDGLIYAMGGQFTHDGCGPGTPDTELSHVFDPATNSWNQIASLPAVQSHTEPSTFVHKGAIYMIGGATMGTTVFRYDPSTDQWDSVAQLPQPLLAPVARVLNDELIVSSGGAPAIVPSFKTYKTDITPLLLPTEQNETGDSPANASGSGGGDTQGAVDDGDSASLDTEDQRCDYSNADTNAGWGWDPVKSVSCPPLAMDEAESESPQTTVDVDVQDENLQALAEMNTEDEFLQTPSDGDIANVGDKPDSNDQPTVVAINMESGTDEPSSIEEVNQGSTSGGGATDRSLLPVLLVAFGLRATGQKVSSWSCRRGNAWIKYFDKHSCSCATIKKAFSGAIRRTRSSGGSAAQTPRVA